MTKRPAPKKPDPKKPRAPATYGPVEIDRDLERMIRHAEHFFSGEHGNTWMEFANRAERMRSLVRETMTKRERKALR